MNKFVLSNIVILLPLVLLADNGACQPPQMPDGRPAPASYARFKDEPPICYADLQPSAKEHHEHRLSFGLMNLGYERILPNSTYIGADVKLVPFYTIDGDDKNTLNRFINSELRMGYNNSFTTKDTLIPYAGMGFSVFKFEKKEGKIRDWNYVTAGAKYLHQFGEVFEMGLHVKAYRSLQEKRTSVVKAKKKKPLPPIMINDKVKLQDKLGNKLVVIEGKLQLDKADDINLVVDKPIPEVIVPPTPEIVTETLDAKSISLKDAKWMMEVSIPLIWHFGQTKNWEILLEPYYMQIPNGKRLHLLGSRLSFGFRF